MAGVSFAIPAFQTTAFHTIGLTDKQSAGTNFAFIFCKPRGHCWHLGCILPRVPAMVVRTGGGVAGLVAGKKCRDPALYSPVLKTMFVGASVGLGAVVATSAVQEQLSPGLLYALLVALMVLCGTMTLGFIGVALSAVVETTHPCSPELSGGMVEFFVQLLGAGFTDGGMLLGSQAFTLCAAAIWLTTALMLTAYRQEFRRSGRGAVDGGCCAPGGEGAEGEAARLPLLPSSTP